MSFAPAQGLGRNPVTLREIADPASLLDTGRIYTNDIAGITELMYLDSAGVETQITSGGGLASGGDITATYVTITSSAVLTNERILTAGTGISITDNGAGNTVTISSSDGVASSWAIGGNTLSVSSAFGANNAFPVLMFMNGAEVARWGINGGLSIGASIDLATVKLAMRRDADDQTIMRLENQNPGADAKTVFAMITDTGAGFCIHQGSSGYAADAVAVADGVVLAAQTGFTNGTSIRSLDPSGGINFRTGGDNQRAEITEFGNVLIGTTVSATGVLTRISGATFVGGNLEIDGNLNHDGSNIGFFGTNPVVQAAAYTPSAGASDRSWTVSSTTIDELSEVLATLVGDLQAYGLLQ